MKDDTKPTHFVWVQKCSYGTNTQLAKCILAVAPQCITYKMYTQKMYNNLID